MPKGNQQPSVAPELLVEFIERLPDALPFLEVAVALGHSLAALRKSVATERPCDSCPKTDCTEICERLEAYLNGPYEGKLHGETTLGVNLDQIAAQQTKAKRQDVQGSFRSFRTVEPFDAMEPYKSCWHRLSPDQREVVQLYYGEGKKIGSIAGILHLAPSSVSGRLKRAKKVKEEYITEMRRNEFLLRKELEAKENEI